MKTKNIIKFFILLLISGFILTACLPKQEKQTDLTIKDINMQLTSPAFEHEKDIPSQYTCDGQNINPPLKIEAVPENTESLALIIDDPDAPSGTFIHWLVWNIDPKTNKIEENSVPQGAIEGMTNFGETGYGGPCPPSGTHRYFFKLYALDTELDLTPNAGKDNLEQAMQGHILDSTELIGLYSRQK